MNIVAMPACELGTVFVRSHVQEKSMDCCRLILRDNLNYAKCMLCVKSVVVCLVKVTGHCEVCLHFFFLYHLTCLMNCLWSFDLPEP
jgi:hypothetical protein